MRGRRLPSPRAASCWHRARTASPAPGPNSSPTPTSPKVSWGAEMTDLRTSHALCLGLPPHPAFGHLLPRGEKAIITELAAPWPSPLMGEGARRADEGGAEFTILAGAL